MATDEPHDDPPAAWLPDVHVFFDEAGTHVDAPIISAGAVEIIDLANFNSDIKKLESRTLAQDHLWQGDDTKRANFAQRGFHYTEDNASVQGELVRTLSHTPFRASVAYSRKSQEIPDRDTLVYMYYIQVFNLLRKYTGEHVAIIFEENSSLNSEYANIVAYAQRRLLIAPDTVQAWIGKKPNTGLSVVDYVLGITNHRLSAHLNPGQSVQPYKLAHYEAVRPHLSYLVEIENGRYRSRSRDMMLPRAQPESTT